MTTAHTSLTDQVTDLQADLATQLPAEVGAVFADEQAGLRSGARPTDVPPAGSPFPDAELLDASGNRTTAHATAAGRPAVVVFYRGAWCPFCNLTLRTYQEQLAPELDRRGVALLAISPQKPDGSLTMKETNDLTFDVLSDPANQIANALGIITAPNADVRQAQTALGLDVTQTNADGTANLPMPTVALVDTTGTIRWIDVHPDYSTRTEPTDLLRAIDEHLSA